MATTFKRIQTILLQSDEQKTWSSSDDLVEHIRNKKLREFQTKKGSSVDIDNYMKKSTLGRLIDYALELGLLDKSSDGQIQLSTQGRTAITNDDSYKLQIKSSVKSLLTKRDAPLTTIKSVAKDIRPPEFPDASTIFKNLPSSVNITEKELRSILFLYALAEGIDRKTKVMYITR